MKHIKIIIPAIIITLVLVISNKSQAQCLDFAKEKGFAALDTAIYIPDGRLNAIPLSEGDNLDVYKPFFRGRKYKVIVVADNIPVVNFKVVNFQKAVIFDSTAGGQNLKEYVFESDKNQNLIISVEIPANSGGTPKTGCVAVLVGFSQK